MTEETAKLALECLKVRLETDLQDARAETAAWEVIGNIVQSIIEKFGDIAAIILGEVIGLPEKKGKLPPLVSIREALMYLAKKATVQDLEIILKDLSDVLEARKQKDVPEE